MKMLNSNCFGGCVNLLDKWVNFIFIRKFCKKLRCFRKNLHSWKYFYTTAGRDGRDKFQVWWLTYLTSTSFANLKSCSPRSEIKRCWDTFPIFDLEDTLPIWIGCIYTLCCSLRLVKIPYGSKNWSLQLCEVCSLFIVRKKSTSRAWNWSPMSILMSILSLTDLIV